LAWSGAGCEFVKRVIPPRVGRESIDARLITLSRELEGIAPESLTVEEKVTARRLMARLIWMLGSESNSLDKAGSAENESGPRIVNWATAKA
jgi:hypothetical protein